MKDRKSSALRRGLSVMGKLLAGTRKGPSGDRVRQLKKFQRRIGMTFTDLGLLEQALTHRSYSHVTSQTRNESNERMEFLGDSVLGLAVSQFLYLQFPDRSEGALSKMKSLLVSRKVLSTVARDAGLGEFLLLSGEESEMGGRDRASILADSFEGVIGAIYLDQGFRAANKYIQRFLLANIHEILKDEEHTNFKSLLQEHVQSKRLSHPVYRVRREEGPEHEKEFAIEVVVRGEVWGIGRGKSKKEAEQNAARAALERRQGREAPARRRPPRDEEAPRPRPEGIRLRAEPVPPRDVARARPDGATPRSAERSRPRETIHTPPRDRGDHGILASREQLRAARRAEAEEREREDREGKSRREDRPRRGGDGPRHREGRGPRPPTPTSTAMSPPTDLTSPGEAASPSAGTPPGMPVDSGTREGAETRERREPASRGRTPREETSESRRRGAGPPGPERPEGISAGPPSPASPSRPGELHGFGRRRRSRRGSGEGAGRPRPEAARVPTAETQTAPPGTEPAEPTSASAVEPVSPARRIEMPPSSVSRPDLHDEPASTIPLVVWEPTGETPEPVRSDEGRPPSVEAPDSSSASEALFSDEEAPTSSPPTHGEEASEGEEGEGAGVAREPGGFHRRKRRHVRGLRRR